MPIVSTFYGITIRMYHGDHAPPHIHAEYQGHRALVAIEDGTIIAGKLLPRHPAVRRREYVGDYWDFLAPQSTMPTD